MLQPSEKHELLDQGLGITNLVNRTTARADELTAEELEKGARALRRKVLRNRPKFLAVLGLSAFRTAFGRPGSGTGAQEESIGDTRIWLLPNPSGLNAHYQLPDLAKLFGDLRQAASDPLEDRPRNR